MVGLRSGLKFRWLAGVAGFAGLLDILWIFNSQDLVWQDAGVHQMIKVGSLMIALPAYLWLSRFIDWRRRNVGPLRALIFSAFGFLMLWVVIGRVPMQSALYLWVRYFGQPVASVSSVLALPAYKHEKGGMAFYVELLEPVIKGQRSFQVSYRTYHELAVGDAVRIERRESAYGIVLVRIDKVPGLGTSRVLLRR